MPKPINLTLNDIPKVAKQIASELQGGEILALVGDLGSGKTTFTKALAKHLKVAKTVTSPTFVIMQEFPAKTQKNNQKITLLHLDLYRTNSFNDIKPLGLLEIWGNKKVITIIEWADKIKNYLPKKTQIIYFKHPLP